MTVISMGHFEVEPSKASQAPVFICMLGSFRLLKQNTQLFNNSPKARLLLSALAMQPRQTIGREHLLDTLWPHTDPRTSGPQLRHMLFKLRRALGAVLGGEPPIVRDGDMYRINMHAGVGIDVSEFETLIALGDKAARSHDDTRAAQHYLGAEQLYWGDLLHLDTESDERAYEVEIERQRLRCMRVRALDHLACYSYAKGTYLDSLKFAHSILAGHPCHEPAHRIIMSCYARRNERALAFAQFEVCQNILRTACGVALEHETIELHERIRLNPESI